MTEDMMLVEGMTAPECATIEKLTLRIGDVEAEFMEATDVPVERGCHLILRAEILGLAGTLATMRDEFGGDGEAMLAMAISMLRHATRDMLGVDKPDKAA